MGSERSTILLAFKLKLPLARVILFNWTVELYLLDKEVLIVEIAELSYPRFIASDDSVPSFKDLIWKLFILRLSFEVIETPAEPEEDIEAHIIKLTALLIGLDSVPPEFVVGIYVEGELKS